MISATGLELRAGARILLSDTTLRVQPGDRIGLVGRNGAGKTTSLKVLAGEALPYAGQIERRGPIGYLPQDPRTGDLDITARDRVLSARGLDTILAEMKKLEVALAEDSGDRNVRRYGVLEDQFAGLGGYAAEAEAARICANLGLPDRVLAQTLGTLSGGQRRRIELARILFADASETGGGTLLLDEPTNHLDADSITWLRGFLSAHKGGLIVISHDVNLLDAVVNKVWYLDANRSVVDAYNLGWKAYQQQRETDERRRHRERANAEKKAGALMAQADKMRAKATKATAAQNMAKRAERLMSGLEAERAHDKVVKVRFPTPVPCGKTPLTAQGLSKSYGSLEIFCDVDLAVDRGSRVAILGLKAPERRPCCGCSRACWSRTPARCCRGTAFDWGTTRRSTRPWTWTARSWSTCARRRRSRPIRNCAGSSAPSCSPATMWTSRPVCSPVARRPGWPCRYWSVRAPTFCCSTSRRTTSTRSAGSRSSTRSPGTRGPSCW